MNLPLLQVENVTKRYVPRGVLRRQRSTSVLAVDQVSLVIPSAHTLGVVGESGSGKTTLGRMVAGLTAATSGRVLVDGVETARIPARRLHTLVQYVYQDPYSALNPRRTVGWSIEVPLRFLRGLQRSERHATVTGILDRVGLRAEIADRYPHELSGGQRQRVVIARALSAQPQVLVLDEPVSALDVSIQAQILMLLKELQEELGLTYLFISHDLAVVETLSHEVAVMNAGTIVESGSCEEIFTTPRQEYTRTLLSAIPGQRPRGDARSTSATPGQHVADNLEGTL